jgi:uncharacterized protein with PQ loop repeat
VSVTSILGGFCIVMAFVFIWPQVIRVYRINSVEGIAPRGTLQGVAGACLWSVYGIAKWNGPLLISNVAVGLAFTLIGVAQVRHKVLQLTALAATLIGIITVGTVLAIINPAATGWVAIAISGTSFVPQTLHVLRSDALRGVSITMYLLLVITGVSWCVYGFLLHDFIISAPNFIVAPCGAVVVLKAWSARHNEPVATA